MKRSIKKSIAVLLIIAIVAGMIPESLLYASAEEVETTKTALDYTIFSGSKRDDFSFSCWRSNIWGDVYTGGSFNYSGSELYIHGNVDAGGVINTSGWKTEIKIRNSNASTIPMPDLDNIIHENAQPFDYIRGSRSYNENDIIINESIKIEDDINFSGSNFMGACYIIAGGDINYNVNTLNQQIDNKVLIYSQDGNIRISGNDITINGILYAPNGSVELNVNTFNLNGRIIADRVTFSGSQFNVKGDSQDLDLIKNKAITKTYTSDQDFLTGELNGLSLSVPNQLILGDKIDNPVQGEEKVYGNIEESNGLKITSVTDKKILMPNNEDLLLTYGLSGFGEEESNQNAVDLVIVMDCSGSMQGTRITNSKNAAKEVVGKMKSNDRCAIVRFTSSAYTVQGLSNDKESLNNAIDSINPSGSTRIYSGISQALDILEKESEEERQKFIILLSDGEDSYSSQSISQAKRAGEQGIRIFALMIGSGTLQMQNIAIHSNGIYKNSPTATEISEIMHFFASEVFDTAGRNTTFKTVIKDKNTIDIDSLIPKPSKVTDNGDGSLNLEWYFERISIHEAEQIKIPFKLTGMLDAGFAELTQETSCVYYDRMGKPTVIYMEDVSAPISRYVEEGKWSVVYDSQEEETPWYSIYWDSNLPGDSRIEVYASVSEDGINFGEAKLIRNYQEISELVGRYIKLDVHMFISSDGRTPELYDITICGKEEVELTHTNLPPIINIITNGRTKVNYPLNVRAEISDDGLPSEMTILWSSNSSNITIANNESLATTVVAQKAGVYQLLCTVSDGEHTRSDTIDIVVEEEDHYDDIDPEGGVEAPAPEIEVNIPKYANPRQKIDAQIINLNQTEISWYSVIINGSQVINVADDGSFSFTTPNSNARQSVVVRAFDWSGKSDMKEYVINIDATVPEIKVTVSAETVMVGDDSPTFTVSISNEHKIQSIQYMLNGQEVSLDENNQYHLDTTYSGTYEFIVKTVTITGEVLTEKALIEVQEAEPDTEGPVITVALIDTVELGESIDLMVMAEDEGGIDRIEVTLNGNLIDLIDGKYEFTPTKEGEYTFNIKAFDMAGNMSELTRVVTVIDTVVILPEFTLNFDKEKYEENDNLTATVVVSGAAIIVDLSVKYDHEEIKLDENNGFTIENLTAGLHTIQVVAKDQSGHQLTKEYSFVVEKKQDSTEPELNVTIDMPEDFKLGDTLVIKVEASDNNGIPTVVVRVNGIELMGQDGTYEFTPLSSGEYNIEVTAMDEAGNISKVSHLIMIDDEEEEPDTTPPELKVTIPENRVISIGETLTFKVEVTDEGGEVIVETQSPGGPVTIQGDTYTYTAHQAGIHTVVITATDQAGNQANYYFEIIVVDDEARDWVVKLIVNNDIPEAEINTEISIKVAVIAENLKDSLVLMVNDEELNLNEHGEATFIPSKKGLYHIIAKVIDEKGKEILEEVELFVYDPEDTNSPDVMIKSPLDGAVVLAPTEIRGSVQGEALIYYTVEYCKSGETEYTEIARGTEVVDDGVLALFDPTLLENGWYQIRLTAYGSNSHKIDEISVSVEGEMKVGNFSTAFRDMDIPVVGFPLTVIRGYDSRKKDVKGDYGYGWDLSTASITLSEACVPGEAWIQTKTSGPLGLTYFSLVEDKPHTVVVDFGNGRIDKFDMKLTPDSRQLTPIQYDISVSYIAKPGTTSKLEALGKTTGLIHNNENLYYSSDFTIYHPEKYKLTTDDGTIYILNDKTGVESITDVNGNVIVFDENGVTHSDGKSIVFERDSEGRITKITGPTGKEVSYQYDKKGDLVSVTDIMGEITSFTYDNNHYLKEIIDPRGVKVARNEYDEDGRLIATIDANGNRMEFSHDIDGRREAVTDRLGNVTVYEYDDLGNVCRVVDPLGNSISYTYDSNGNLRTKTDALGNVTTYEYSIDNKLLSLTDAYGNVVKSEFNNKGRVVSVSSMGVPQIVFNYDEYGRETEMEDALGNKTYISYDKKGRIVGVSDDIGDYFIFTYDGEGNITSSTNGEGETATFTYDSEGRCISKTSTRNSSTGSVTLTENYTYDASGQLLQVIYSDGTVVNVEYNSIGLVSATVDSKGRRTTYEYDLFGNLVKINYCDNTFETYEYDAEDRNTAFTDRMGRRFTMKYDSVGNLLSMTYPNGSSVRYTYDANYQLIEVKGVNGSVTKYEYDALGRNTAIVNALGNRTEFAYNEYSQLSSMTDPKGNTFRYEYDANGNRLKAILPDGSFVSSSYDARGRIISQTDQNGYTTSYKYDRADRLTSVTDALGNTWNYTYNNVGELVTVADANGNKTKYTYDELGRVISTENALGDVAEITYDKAGNVLTLKNYSGVITTYDYDQLDRVIKEVVGNETIHYTYTVDGMLSTVTDKNGVTKYSYDLMNGLTKVENPDGTIINYEYDEACRLTKVNTSYGETSYSYDNLDRLVRVVGHDGMATVYEYDANGNRSAVRYANGMIMTYEYDSANRLIKEEIIDKDSNLIASYVYTLGAAGERIKVEEIDRTVEYEYDALYRLCKEIIIADGKTRTISYTYDAVGNRTSKTEDGKVTKYTYNELNQLISENDTFYTYDKNGNLIAKVDKDNKSDYTYDLYNRLIRATIQSGQDVLVEEYRYDWAGNRIAKITENEEIRYLIDTNGWISQVLAETDETGNLITWYSRGAELISLHRANETRYYLYDGHGSVRMLADEEGLITDTYTYDAFGNLIDRTGNTKNDFLFYGEQFDANTGFYYLRARYMNPSTGTFITMDVYQGSIFDPVSLHKYLYANANPIMNSDPTGYFTLAELNVSTKIQGILSTLAQPRVRVALRILDFLTTAVETTIQISRMLEGGATAEDILDAIARGVISSVFLNYMCKIKGIGPFLEKIIIGMGFYNQFESIVEAIEDGDYGLAALRTFDMVNMGISLADSCFTGETLIATEDGHKRIDEIQIGDKVWSYNVETDELALKEVINVFVRETKELIHLTTDTGNIDTTSNHPFYVVGKGWVAAGDLKVGDQIYALDGSTATVLIWECEELEEPLTVYNFEVEDYHSYFVGEFGVLVHNSYDAAGEAGKGGSQAGKNVFPDNPDDLLSEIPRDKVTKSNGGTSQKIPTSDNVIIRAETHPLEPGETYNPRHHGQHYHVEYKIDPSKSWNNKNNVTKAYPPGYTKGSGTGFLPGEEFPH